MKETTKAKAALILCFAVLPFLIAGCVTRIDASDLTEDSESTISVSGTARAAVTPDRVEILIAVETRATTAKEAESTNADLSNGVIDAIKDAGIRADDIETSSFSLYPIYDYSEDSQPSVIGYTAAHALSVKTDNVEKAGAVIDAAIAAGANRVDSIQFTLSDQQREKVYRGVLGEAAQDAEAKAKAIAETLRLSIKGVKTVTTDYSIIPVYAGAPEVAMKREDLSFAPADVEVSATISIVYEIE